MAFAPLGIWLLVALPASGAAAPAAAGEFERRVQPILAARCTPCHSDAVRTSGFSVATLDSVLAGGAKYGRVAAGGAERSPQLGILKGELTPKMPLGQVLDAADLAAIEAWVPIVDLRPQPGTTPEDQRRDLDLLRWLNETHAAGRSNASELEARIAAYELAYRMQVEAPELVDVSRKSAATRSLYGLDDPRTEAFGQECLLARRMVERGVRFVLALHGAGKGVQSWDDHGDTAGRIPKHCYEIDRPVAGLLTDLKSRGLLEETLVVWASEMGRTPFDTNVVTETPGREHNQYGLVAWLAGGNVRAGATFGQTDDFGIRSAEEPIPLRDFHATLLRLLGLDQERLTYLHAGRYKKLTDIGGRVITEVIV